ncbi:cytochrome o ubiquinol oxidase subunit III [Gluconacetobacter tumulicola]|uniref:Cytochrome bo(3) ubiquinol oxidase subunit 3 n=1 Tax=Gluconacetobacter tumulicola TaxID=1017177 RepID=A0A7W4JCR6_9PROT|nr:cytochrome o ubiquinol oxidase subunit III [Gluconacetobacter tumulicola]MBB2178652.1 cytochrome o ubiquinol oxidase subunit III [Gluconacetobacter tumulicola]
MIAVTSTHMNEAQHHHAHDDGKKTIVGFWLYLMTDCLIFASLFATYGVLAHATAGGPGGRDLFDLGYVGFETLFLLLSSFTFGLAVISAHKNKKGSAILWLGVTFVFGLSFIGMEIDEFTHLIAENAGPGRSAFLSSYFGLVGTHGLHVTVGLLWLAVMIHQVSHFGLNAVTQRRLACLSLFWHFLDLVWVCVFSIVYLGGVL